MKKTFNIYDISKGSSVFIQEVEKESDAQDICREHNKAGDRNYMYLPSCGPVPLITFKEHHRLRLSKRL